MRPPVKKGDVMKSYHPSRKRMAVRLDNEERERAGDLKPREPWEHKPGVMESEDGHECPVCHLKIKATISGLRIATHTMKGGKFNRNGSVHCQGSGTKLSNEAT